ncbi:MAG TPA: tetratricopeptide repeat protein [Terriglobales bacterium]|nr:tetratricopeptide repeat protein [Terriglobales bacterium]
MRRVLIIALLLFAAQVANAGEPCDAVCKQAKKDARTAEKSFRKGQKLAEKGKTKEALALLDEAVRLQPTSATYVTTRELVRLAIAQEHLVRGQERLEAKRYQEAIAEFRTALELDPGNEVARERLRGALSEIAGTDSVDPTAALLQKHSLLKIVADSREVTVAPRPGRRDFHFRGAARDLLKKVGAEYGLTVAMDDSVPGTSVRFDLEQADFETAMDLACRVTRTFWVPLAAGQILVAQDTQTNRRQFQPVALRTFELPNLTSAAEMTELVTVLRSVLEIRAITVNAANGLITVRAPLSQVEAATRFLEELVSGPAQVMLDVKVFEVDRTVVRELGLDLPLQFRIFNLPSEARQLLQSAGGQSVIDQLIASGGLNQVDPAAIAALLAQLQQGSVLTQNFAVFGGGITLTGVTLPPLTLNLQLNESNLRLLEHASLRAAHGKETTLRIGQRFPILNASFSPILNSPALTQVIQNQSFQTAFPSFYYEDLGLNIKATPYVQGGQDVALKLELELKALSGQSLNSVPILSNRLYTGSLTVRDGETAVVAGMVTQSEQKAFSRVPVLGHLPVLGRPFSNENLERKENQLLVLVTPYIVNLPQSAMVAVP